MSGYIRSHHSSKSLRPTQRPSTQSECITHDEHDVRRHWTLRCDNCGGLFVSTLCYCNHLTFPDSSHEHGANKCYLHHDAADEYIEIMPQILVSPKTVHIRQMRRSNSCRESTRWVVFGMRPNRYVQELLECKQRPEVIDWVKDHLPEPLWPFCGLPGCVSWCATCGGMIDRSRGAKMIKITAQKYCSRECADHRKDVE